MPSTDGSFRGISLKKELVDAIEEYMKSHEDEGYRSVAEFVSECVRLRIRDLKEKHASFSEGTP